MPSNDPLYQKKYIRKHYQANKQYYKDKARDRTDRLRPRLTAFVNRYKQYVGCVDCSYKAHPHAHHFVSNISAGLRARMFARAKSLNQGTPAAASSTLRARASSPGRWFQAAMASL